MLNRQSMSVVSQLRDVSDSIVFTYPITGIRSSSGSIFAFLDVKKLGSEEFEEFGILKFKELVDLINVAGTDAEISLDNKVINIKSDKIKCRYITTSIDTLDKTFKAPIAQIEKTNNAEAAMTFTINSNELSQIKKVSALLGIKDLVISCDDNNIFVRTENYSQKNSNDFNIKMEDCSVNIPNTTVILGMDNFKKLPDGNYTVKVCTNGNSFITRFDSTTIDGLIINIATKAC